MSGLLWMRLYLWSVQWPDVLVSSSNNPLTPATRTSATNTQALRLLASRTSVSLSLSLFLFLFPYIVRPRYGISSCARTARKNLLFTGARRNDRWIWKHMQKHCCCIYLAAYIKPGNPIQIGAPFLWKETKAVLVASWSVLRVYRIAKTVKQKS